jgi:signal transduction histidine kinase
VVQDVLPLVHGEARRRRVCLRTELSPGLPAVRGDRVQLQQVILNLLTNGIEAVGDVAGRPRELQVRSRQSEAGEVVVAVQDSGVGIGTQRVARLFDPFVTTKPGALGMGLSISRSIVEAHGGRLWASPNAGPGATFQFALPSRDAVAP